MTGHDKSCLAGIDKDAEMVVGVNCLGILRHSRSLAGSTVCVGEMKRPEDNFQCYGEKLGLGVRGTLLILQQTGRLEGSVLGSMSVS